MQLNPLYLAVMTWAAAHREADVYRQPGLWHRSTRAMQPQPDTPPIRHVPIAVYINPHDTKTDGVEAHGIRLDMQLPTGIFRIFLAPFQREDHDLQWMVTRFLLQSIDLQTRVAV